ncbi:VapE family protein [Segatella hominis]|uniref:VapE domain-containing protein n=1 Tax=Segatella hominis TaxID=2518605 RepID=UPI001C443BE3|nr:VapE domain-containing protein [Segatella hominis]WOZ80721.1 VapE family protein [Segatella hominis]
MEEKRNFKSSMMTGNQLAIYQVESFLEESYLFRRNVLNGKTEFICIKPVKELEEEEPENSEAKENSEIKEISEKKELEKKEVTLKEENPEEKNWKILTAEAFNSIVRRAKKLGIGEQKSPRQDIEEYIKSDAVLVFDPIQEYMNKLPKWDGKNHVAALFGRIPGLTSEQLAWCATWFRSAVAHWLQMDMLPEELRQYFLDHINFGNKFDSEMALTHNLIVNVDELANITVAQQGKLKQTLSKVKVNGRPIFGKSQADRRRYASFLATTNDEHPLCDPTGSRRYLCLRVPDGEFIDNNSAINYDQLYAQMVYELRDKKTPYWFTNDEVARIQECNLPFFKVDDLEPMINYCFRMPEEKEEGKWMVSSEVFDVLHLQYPMLVGNMSTKVKIGQTLKFMGCKSKHTKHGQAYQLFALSA